MESSIEISFDTDEYLSCKGRDPLTVDRLSGEQLVYILYVKQGAVSEGVEVLHFDWVMRSSVKEKCSVSASDRAEKYNPQWVMKNELSSSVITETTHLVAGYYDLIEGRWVPKVTRKVDQLDPECISEVLTKNFELCAEDFYSSKSLFLQNIKCAIDSPVSTHLLGMSMEGKLNLKLIVEQIFDWCEAEGASALLSHCGYEIFPSRIIVELLAKKKIPGKDSIGLCNYWRAIETLSAHDICQIGIFDCRQSRVYFGDTLNEVDVAHLHECPQHFNRVGLFSNRFAHVFLGSRS